MQARKDMIKRYAKFGIVGLSGLLVNIGIAYILKNIFSVKSLIASSLAIEVSILNNFFWNSIWTWRDREQEDIWVRLLKYHVAVSLGAIINMGADFLLLK
ncbi:MAG: glycosyltransferase family 2 protein, partial [Candidatus Hydrothermota bacterium]